MLTRLCVAVLIVSLAAPAAAQLRLPALTGLPALPVTSTLQSLPQNLDRAADVRHSAIDRLIRTNRRLIERDDRGDPIVRSQILAWSLSDTAANSAAASGFALERSQSLGIADLRVVLLRCPPGVSTQAGLKRLRELDPSGTYDYNHIYMNSGVIEARVPGPPAPVAPLPSSNRPRIRIGLLDTGIDASHPDFYDSSIHAFGCGDKSIPALHGTAVASLLIAQASADLYAADVYCGSPTGGAADAIIAALAWMMRERVAVINISLVGPKNALLERAVALLIARGHIIVAAVGNDGPTAPPLYPAAYAQVVGVTAVDAHRRVLFEALRGPQVMFAALGADIAAANTERARSGVRGTSFAAPCVAARLAQVLVAPDAGTAQAAIEGLAKQAIDLGTPGRDLTYGFGFVGAAAL